MVLYMASGPEFEKMMKNSTPEQQKKGMDAWMKWMNANKTSIVEGGAPLGKTKRVDSNGASNTKNEVGGYSVVQAESHDAATKIFGKDHPHARRMDRNHGDHAAAWDVVANATSLHRRSADTRERGWYVGARGMSEPLTR
jgi:hypothetical protein